ncbi:MAG: ABC transporter permease [Gloeobacteraceae cyanobacterium ES-bin-144]|nr:ABC transporter permease [Verrucomicrobiales bacterium]
MSAAPFEPRVSITCPSAFLALTSGIKRRSFSFLLARRYLNPRRSMLSSFTLISLIGVMLGVLVLVVVMAVYAGLERQVKGRILGFTPHILLRHLSLGFDETPPLNNWQEVAKRAITLPRVQSATAFISDNVIIDVASWQRPIMFRGIDTSDPVQVDGIAKMLDLENHPDSSADLGLDDRAVISSTLAEQLALRVGDTIRLYSTRNFSEVMDAYKSTENPPLREAFAAPWNKSTQSLASSWKADTNQFSIAIDTLTEIYDSLNALRSETMREPERTLLETLLVSLEAGEKDEAAKLYRFSADLKTEIEKSIADINSTDRDKMDGETLKSLKKIVLPKEAKVIGVYQSSQMAITPDIFIPLPLAQGLAGLNDAVQGIALRLDDAYASEEVADEARKALGPDWALLTWGDQYKPFFALINQQRVMMYFALSFIVLVSAFSMMAVMFTVTIQKRREIGVMKALGAAPGQIVRVFLYQGMLLGLLGALLGIGLGRLVIHFRGPIQEIFRTLGFDPFSSSFTGFGILPAHNDPVEQAVIGFMAFVLCSLAALVPAFFAARSDAAKSLRNL